MLPTSGASGSGAGPNGDEDLLPPGLQPAVGPVQKKFGLGDSHVPAVVGDELSGFFFHGCHMPPFYVLVKPAGKPISILGQGYHVGLTDTVTGQGTILRFTDNRNFFGIIS